MRFALIGAIALLVSTLIIGILNLLGIRHSMNVADLSGWVIAVSIGSIAPILILLCFARYFQVWPFSN